MEIIKSDISKKFIHLNNTLKLNLMRLLKSSINPAVYKLFHKQNIKTFF